MADVNYALITGASSGIGECFARALAARGSNLVLVARSRDKLEALAIELRREHSIRTEVLPEDLASEGSVARLAASVNEQGVAIDLLVNDAGFGAGGEFTELPLDRQVEMINLNIRALVELTHFLARRMAGQRRGAIINVSSTASFQPIPYTAVYAATKAFVTSFSLALEEELRPLGIKVVTLCPGGTATKFWETGKYGKMGMPGGLQSADEVVKEALKKLDSRGGLAVPRWINKLMVASLRITPRGIVIKAAGRMFRP